MELRRNNRLFTLALLMMAGCGPAAARVADGPVTDRMKPLTSDCGAEAEPPNVPTLKGARVGDGWSILLRDAELPQGLVGIIEGDTCEGAAPGGATVKKARPSFLVVALSLESEQTGVGPAQPADLPRRYRMRVLDRKDWPKK